jgi:hypothetical protein
MFGVWVLPLLALFHSAVYVPSLIFMPDSDPVTQPSPWPSSKGLWGLLWRSTVLLPIVIILFTVWMFIWGLVLVLPFVVVISLVLGNWLYGLALAVIWAPLFLLSRWKRFRVDSKDTLSWENGNI